MNEAPKHADHIEDADEKRRRKMAEFIINRLDDWNAARAGMSTEDFKEKLSEEIAKDFDPAKTQDKDKEQGREEDKGNQIIKPMSERSAEERAQWEKEKAKGKQPEQEQDKDR